MGSTGKVFGTLAVERGYVSAGALEECVRLQRAQGAGKFIGEILLERKLITPEQLLEVLAEQERHGESSDGRAAFGQIALENRLVSAAAIRRALETQEEERAARRVPRRIGEILGEQGAMSTQQIRAVGKAQERLRRSARKQDLGLTSRPSWRRGILIGVAGFLMAVVLGRAGLTRWIDDGFYDRLHAYRLITPHDPRIAVVYIGDRDLREYREKLGRWPWANRLPHAAALELLTRAGAERVGYDVLFTEPSRDAEDSDGTLAVAMARAPGLVHGALFRLWTGGALAPEELSPMAREVLAERTPPTNAAAPPLGGTTDPAVGPATIPARVPAAPTGPPDAASASWAPDLPIVHAPELPIDPLLECSRLLGHVLVQRDDDGAVRRVPLFVRYGNHLVPGLALQLALAHFGATVDQVRFSPGVAVSLPLPGGRELRVPVDEAGRMLLRFERPASEYTGFSYTQLDSAAADAFRDRIVLVGFIATGHTDTHITPMGAEFPGLLVHAQALENLLTGRFVTGLDPMRRPFHGREAAALFVLLVGCLALGLLIAWGPRGAGFLGAPPLLVFPWAASAGLFLGSDLWIAPGAPAAGLVATGLLAGAYRGWVETRERLRTRLVFERYLAPQVLQLILKQPDLLHLGGRRMELTVFFSDIRGFTDFSERMPPEELLATLNEYFTRMTDVVHRHGGTLDKIVGDCLMVFFGDPIPQPDHACRAVRMALDMRAEMQLLKKEWEARGRPTFDIGMGIHTGWLMVGNLGSDYFTNYTVVGSTVNVAARIEHGSGPGQIRISEKTWGCVRDRMDTRELGPERFKGVSEPMLVYEVVGEKGKCPEAQG